MLKDWRGTEIEIGSRIVYGVKQSCSISLQEAVVLDFVNKKRYEWDNVLHTFLKVEVIRTSDDWRKVPYKGMLENVYNVTVIKE